MYSYTKALLLTLLITCPLDSVAADNCVNVTGEFKEWNGWPPVIRLEDEQTGIYYAIPGEGDDFPAALSKRIQAGTSLRGTYCLNLLGEEVNLPYQNSPIKLVSIVTYTLEE